MPTRPPSHRPARPPAHDPRPSAARRGYGRAWQKASKAYLAGQCCKDCEERGIITPATQLHHLERHQGDPSKVMDLEQTRPLCASCHSKRTARGE